MRSMRSMRGGFIGLSVLTVTVTSYETLIFQCVCFIRMRKALALKFLTS